MGHEQYSKVTRRMWSDDKFRKLSRPKPNAQTLWFYLLTGKHCTSIPGLLCVGVLGLAEELEWPVAATRKCLQELVDAGMAVVDAGSKLVWLPNSLRKHNMPANPSVVLGWAAPWRLLPECALRAEAADSMRAALEEEDLRRVEDSKPAALVAAFRVVLGELSLVASGLKVGRPKRHEGHGDEQGEEHRVPDGVPHGVQDHAEHATELQEQEQEQEREAPPTPRGGGAAGGPGARAPVKLSAAGHEILRVLREGHSTHIIAIAAFAKQLQDFVDESGEMPGGRPLEDVLHAIREADGAEQTDQAIHDETRRKRMLAGLVKARVRDARKGDSDKAARGRDRYDDRPPESGPADTFTRVLPPRPPPPPREFTPPVANPDAARRSKARSTGAGFSGPPPWERVLPADHAPGPEDAGS